MIKFLHIENIAVIEKSDIEFTDGFNVLTGETGAGKSIVIDAINAILGERTSRELIRSGCDSACVSAVFCDLSKAAEAALHERGFGTDEDGGLAVSRVLSASGKGSVRINGQPSTAGVLREIAAFLVNIHGQHDNQSLLDSANHCAYIDAVADDGVLIDEYYSEFRSFVGIRRELSSLETDEDEKQRRTELLKYQINELQSAKPQHGEYERLRSQLEIVRNYEKTMLSLEGAYHALNGSEESDGAVSLITEAERSLTQLKTERLAEAAARLNEALCILEAAAVDIRAYEDEIKVGDINPEEIEERLDLLRRLMLKYGDTEDKCLSFLENAVKELEAINFSEERAEALGQELDKSTGRLVAAGKRLTEARMAAAKSFEDDVTGILAYLDMPDVRFRADFKTGHYTKKGCDEVEFLISANAGEEVRPLHRIASGGELSRIMLAIKSVLADRDTVDTLIFDEIDTGISGRAAGKVGVQLCKVSKSRQVICVTHLAQIAAAADNHLLIEKTTENGRTFTMVSRLPYDKRIGEIARIMSGTELTENLYNSAKELLDRSNTNGNL